MANLTPPNRGKVIIRNNTDALLSFTTNVEGERVEILLGAQIDEGIIGAHSCEQRITKVQQVDLLGQKAVVGLLNQKNPAISFRGV